MEFVKTHVHSAAPKRDAFHLQAKPLIHGMMAAQLDVPAGADNALPGKIDSRVKRPHHLARCAGIARGLGDRAISRHVATRHSADGGNDLFSHSCFSQLPRVIVS